MSDFRKVAPRYGTNEDLIRIFREVKARGMRVCLDFVAGHTSSAHPWFQASSLPEPNKFTNWYVWTNSVWDPGDESVRTVNGYSDRDENYATNFYYFQPAINYRFSKPDPAKPWQLALNPADRQTVARFSTDGRREVRLVLGDPVEPQISEAMITLEMPPLTYAIYEGLT